MADAATVVDCSAMSTYDLIVYHDGSCPVCRMEIGRYRRSVGAERIDFVDVSDEGVDPGPDLPCNEAMGRFHVRMPSGELKAGQRPSSRSGAS